MEQEKNNKRRCSSRMAIKDELHPPPSKKPNNNQDEPESSVDELNIKVRCTLCYKPDVDKKCTTCNRHFHSKCMKWTNTPSDWKCYACLKLKQVPNPSQLDYNLTEMLTIYETMLKFDERIANLKPLRQEDIEALKKIFFERVKSRIQQSQFQSADQFVNIIHKLVFDVVTVLADKKSISFVKLKTWADAVIKHCKDNMRLLDLCSKCFINKSKDPINWFTDVCESRHRVVWANATLYWPAKVLKEDVKWITVQYFDDHEIDKISPKNIIDYSDNNPNDAMDEESILRLNNYTKDVKRYMEKLGVGTPPDGISKRFSSVLNRYTISIAASHQLFLRELQSAKDEDLQAHRLELNKLKEEKEQLAQVNGANIDKIIADSSNLAAENAQLIAENVDLKERNNRLADTLLNIQTENARLLTDMANMKTEVEVAESQRKKLQEKINKLFE